MLFVRGGLVGPGSDLRFAGLEGLYWSSVGVLSSSAYYLYFNSGNVIPSFYASRYLGFPVRCVALGG